ncbi:MAG: hypothetical protein LQ338_002068 [Usnochroma carphineum]|nr:MAG: hypothetical protein LQ338_002068 [Usnochroma carphineum]
MYVLSLFLLNTLVYSAFSASVGCFRRQVTGEMVLYPTTFKECYAVQRKLVQQDKAQAPITFSRKAGIGYKVPDYWTVGNCALTIDLHSEDDIDTMSFYDIAVQAGVLNVGCVAKPPHFGGTCPVGPKKVMNVTLLGFARSTQLGFNDRPPSEQARNVSVS